VSAPAIDIGGEASSAVGAFAIPICSKPPEDLAGRLPIGNKPDTLVTFRGQLISRDPACINKSSVKSYDGFELLPDSG
jgi:hypothetical protein